MSKIEILTKTSVDIETLLDLIIDHYEWDVKDGLFKAVKYIIEQTDNDWEDKLNDYFKSQKVNE